MNKITKRSMNANLNSIFEIELKSTGTSGFEWKPSYNSSKLNLLEKRSVPNLKKMGASNKVVFKFKPLSRGDHEIIFALVRPWEDTPPAAQEKITLHID
jgi:predicted secreted protein